MQIDLSQLPDNATAHGVDAGPAQIAGRRALRIALNDKTRNGTHGVDYVDEPTFLLLPIQFRNGTLEVEMLSRLLPDAPDFARGFIGLAYRVLAKRQSYESVYLRPTNGRKANPPPQRGIRAVQYYAYPDWKFDRLRAEEPDGPYEAGADIGPDEWMKLRLEIEETHLRAFVNGAKVLDITQNKAAPLEGQVGLWVDIGTEGFFSMVSIMAK